MQQNIVIAFATDLEKFNIIHTDVCDYMGSKNISISDEAYSRLKKFKGKNESFTDVINRLTNKATLLDLQGTLTRDEAESILKNISEVRKLSGARYQNISERLEH